MRRRFLGVVLLVFALSALLLPGAAQAGSTYHFKGKSAFAYFSSVDSSGCVVAEAFVQLSEVSYRSSKPKSGDEYPSVSVAISHYDMCTDTRLLEAYGSALLGQGAFAIDSQLKTAAVQATLSLEDFVSGTTQTVHVSVSWTATGEPFRSKYHSSYQTEGFKYSGRFDGTSRQAAATGAVTSGATNYTPEPAVYAAIESAKSGSVDISH